MATGLLLLAATFAPAASAASSPLPAYASLTYRLSSGANWATVSLVGGSVVDAAVTSSSLGAATSVTSNGIALHNSVPSWSDGSNSLPPEQTTVNIVYSFVPGAAVTFEICKSDLGSVAATVSRNEGPDHTQTGYLVDSHSGASAGGCQNESSVQLTQQTLTGPTLWPTPLDANRHVLAVYYPWYDPTTFARGAWAEIPQPPFDTSTPASIGAQIDEARSQHIDGFVVSYDGNPTYAQRLSAVTAAAASRPGFYVAPMLEMNQLIPKYLGPSVVAGLAGAINGATARTAGPNQLQVGGRPVVFVFDAQELSPLLWRAVRMGLNPVPFFVADTTSSAYGFDGLYDYSSNFAGDNQIARQDLDYEKVARWKPAVGGGSQRLWVAPVSPGENSCVSSPPDDRMYVGREGGARYDYAWQAAYASEPNWVLISTWNEWVEDTAIAPGGVSGSKALGQTGPYAESFRADPLDLPASSYAPPGLGNASRTCP